MKTNTKKKISLLPRLALLLIVGLITFSELKAQYPIVDESGLDLGYVTTYDYVNKSFFYDFTFVTGQSYPECINGTLEIGKINYDTTYLKASSIKGSCMTTRELTDTRIMSYGGNYEDWFKPMVFKKVYYGDVDASVTIKETDLIVTGKPLNDMPFYVFSVYDKLDEGKYIYTSGIEFCLFGCTPGFVSSYNTFRTRRKYGTTEAVTGSLQKHNYVFKVSDWTNNSFLGNIEYSIERGNDQLKRLNQGVEVYVVSKQYSKENYYLGYFENRLQFLRTIVYPKKPAWKTASIPAKICRGSVIDLRTWVDMKGLPFNGKFEVISGGNSLIEGAYNINTENVTGFVAGKKEITIRCYPYYKDNVSSSGAYPENMWNVFMDVKILVYDKPSLTDGGVQIVCSSSAAIDLQRYTPAGGTYSGSYISSNRLNVPSAVSANIYNISTKYSYTDANGCQSEVIYNQEITQIPTINFNVPTTTCKETKINLNNVTTPSGGVFSGNGVDGAGMFNPVSAGIGVHNLTYSIGGVCPASTTKQIEVLELQPEEITISPIPKQCRDGAKLDLMGFASYQGGSFIGPGIEGSRYFNPATATVGINTITYRVGGSNCIIQKTFTIEVANSVGVSFSAIGRICEAKEISLDSYVSVSGGSFNGPGVVGKVFNSEAAGVGTHTVFYTVTAGGCSGTASTNIVVADLLPNNVYFESLPRMCKSDINNFIDLRGYLKNHSGGTFSGTGVEGNYFYPSRANVGSNIIYYNYGQSVCAKTVKVEVIVNDKDNISFYKVPTICKSTTVDLMQYVTPQGGEFFGPGVTGKRYFNSGSTGTGKFTITYRYFNGNCYGETVQEITVDAILPSNIIFDDLPTTCKSGDAINLREYVNTSLGSFSGNGVVSEFLNPSSAVVGVNVINFTIQEGSCKSTYPNTIKILKDPVIIFNEIGDVCTDMDIDLINYVYPYGGSFSGKGISGTIFKPSTAGIGENYINYSYSGEGGCSSVMSKKIVVNGLLPITVNFNKIPELCPNSESIDLTQYVEPKTGYFTGPGIVGSKFDPKISGSGTFLLKYTVESGSCKREVSQTVTVKNELPIIFNDISVVCKDDLIDLENYIFPTGGTFSGKGVTGNSFNPEDAGVGETFIYYSLNMDGCNTTTSKKVTIKATVKDFTFNASRTMCKNEDPVDLWGDVIGYGGTNGTFAGNGVVASIFNPASANIGGNLIKFTISENGCVFNATSTITILQSPSVTFNAIGDICNNEEIELTTYVNPTGGTFSGSGVTGTKFNPGAAGLGTKYIYYQYTGANGCKETKQQLINVKALLPTESSIVISTIPSLCGSDNPINLREYINRTDGNFAGTGVVGNLFDPRISGSGSFEIRYINSSGSCRVEKNFTIVVLSSPEVIFNSIPNICYEGKIPLNDYVYPKGGVFSGSGVQSDTLNVKLAGVGSHNIYYAYSAGGCSKSVSKTVTISAVIPNFTIKDIPSLCKNGDPIELRGYVDGYTGNNGTFSGKGIVGGVLNPSQADVGGNLIKYTVVEGGCSREAVKTITIVANPQITFNTVPLVCNDNYIDLSKYVFPTGGTFSGSGITGNSLYPKEVGVGETYINYRVEGNNGCYSIAQQTVSVGALIPGSLEFSDPGMICKMGKEINLRNFVNTDYGTFSGNGVVGDYFYPNNATIGSNSIKFSIVQGTCKAEKERLILVKDDGELLFSEIPALCYKTPIDLSNYVYPKGGVFRGSGVSGNIFNPEVAGIGRHKIVYDVLSESGCTSTLERTVEVKNLYTAQENIAINLVNDICLNSPAVDLRQFVSPLGGYFSGPGIIGNNFDPGVAGLGIHQVYYTIGQVDCNQSKGFTVRVIGNGTVSVEQIPLVCGSDLNLADYVNPTGGTFTGKYVVNGVFKGENAPTDTFTVKYNVSTDEGCTVSKDIRVSNYKMPSINIGISETNIQPGGVIQFIPQGLSGNLDMYSYSWTFGDGGWSVEQKPWHYYYHRGVFDLGFRLNVKTNECYKEYKEQGTLSVTDENGRKIFFKGRLIYEENSEKEISISPNPFTEGINLEGVSVNASVMLFDITGREVKRWTGGGYVELNELKPGIYILQTNGSSKKFKLVKQ